MLVLSRKTKETIVIDGQIEITVVKVKGNSVRLGIQAPASIKVLRGELPRRGMAASSSPVVADMAIGQASDALNQLPNPFAVTSQVV